MVVRSIVNELNEEEHVKGQVLRIFGWIQFQVSFPSRIIKIIKSKIETHFQLNKHHTPLQILYLKKKKHTHTHTQWVLTVGV
jgi:hypothetical protein